MTDQMEKPSLNILFSKNINLLLTKKNKTRKDVCRDLDIKYTTFCDWVNGRSVPKSAQIGRLSDYFQVSPSYFFIEGDLENTPEEMTHRLNGYVKKTRELPVQYLEALSDEQIKDLLDAGFLFQHKTLEQYIEASGGELLLSETLDWGAPVGREVW